MFDESCVSIMSADLDWIIFLFLKIIKNDCSNDQCCCNATNIYSNQRASSNFFVICCTAVSIDCYQQIWSCEIKWKAKFIGFHEFIWFCWFLMLREFFWKIVCFTIELNGQGKQKKRHNISTNIFDISKYLIFYLTNSCIIAFFNSNQKIFLLWDLRNIFFMIK